MFTRTQFQVIAKILRDVKPEQTSILFLEYLFWKHTVKAFSERFAMINGNFKEDKFFEACGLTDKQS